MELIIGIIGIIIAWLFFSNVIKARTDSRRKFKAALVVLLFSGLILGFSHDFYAVISRTLFSLHKQGEVDLTVSPFSIPGNQNNTYCHQFLNQHGQPINTVSTRSDGRYCGDFWGFKTHKQILLPYKLVDATHAVYWASPDLNIIGPKPLEKSPKTQNQPLRSS